MTPEKRLEFRDQSHKHYDADILIKGTYGKELDGFKGCSIGCHLHHIYANMTARGVVNITFPHQLVANHYGLPEWMTQLQDAIFEGLPCDENTLWHKQFADVVFTHSDDFNWTLAYHRVISSILKVTLKNASTSTTVIQDVIALHDMAANGNPVSAEDWKAAWPAAAWPSAARAVAERAVAWAVSEVAAHQDIRDGVLKALEEPTS